MDWVMLGQCTPRFMLLAVLIAAVLWTLASQWLVYERPLAPWSMLVPASLFACLALGLAVYGIWYIVTSPGVGCGS